jgi:hypothetical protein
VPGGFGPARTTHCYVDGDDGTGGDGPTCAVEQAWMLGGVAAQAVAEVVFLECE